VWPEYVMKNPLVQLQQQRRQNELNFANHQESAIRETLAALGLVADQQQLSSAPPLSHAGTRAALDAADETVFNALKRSRGYNFDEETSHKFRVFAGDTMLFYKQVARQESRANALRNFVAFNSRTVSACEELLGQQAEEKVAESITSILRYLRVGHAKYKSVVDRATAAERHSELYHRTTNEATKQHHLKNLRGCATAAQADVAGGHDNFDLVYNALTVDKLEGFDADTENAVEDLRVEFAALDSLRRRADVGYARISHLVNLASPVLDVAANIAAIENVVPEALNPVAAADAPDIAHLVAPAPANVEQNAPAPVQPRRQRRCKTCKRIGHQSNSSQCPGAPQDFDL
jgi:hypothetical protein